jgi:hypothetical protein
VLVALLLVALFGLAGLVIDLGMARLAQRQMQSAAESAALEGLRYRNLDPIDPELDPAQLAQRRRERAARRVGQMFDDDLMDTPDADPLQFGAGALIELSGGVPMPGDHSLLAGQTLSVAAEPELRVYKPQGSLELNEPNAEEGDIVFGQLGPNANVDPANPYSRADFAPDPLGNSLIVRLRRTAGFPSDEAGYDVIPGVSSTGPALPYLFARGVLLSPAARARGIPLRATALADGTPAKSAGPPIPVPDTAPPQYLPGLAPFALTLDYWNDGYWATAAGESLVVNGSDLQSVRLGSAIVGRIYTPTAGDQIVSLGETLASSAGSQPLDGPPELRRNSVYIPIVRPNGTGWTVVGFGYAEWPDGVVNNTLEVMRPFDAPPAPANQRTSRFAAGNATAVLADRLPAALDLDQLMSDHAAVVTPLLSPALRR